MPDSMRRGMWDELLEAHASLAATSDHIINELHRPFVREYAGNDEHLLGWRYQHKLERLQGLTRELLDHVSASESEERRKKSQAYWREKSIFTKEREDGVGNEDG